MNNDDFIKELATLLNKYGKENVCDMPDFLLAMAIDAFIDAIGPSIKRTLDWHGCDSICHPATLAAKIKEQPDRCDLGQRVKAWLAAKGDE